MVALGRRRGRVGAARRRLGRRDGLRHRAPGRVRPAGVARRPGSTRRCTASCAIPGWYAPVADRRPPLRRRRHAARPPTSTCWRREGLDEVYVLAPMASFVDDHPRPARDPARAAAPAAGDPAAARTRRQKVTLRRRGGHHARARTRGPRGDRRQPDGPRAAARGARDLAAHQRRRHCADPRPDELEPRAARCAVYLPGDRCRRLAAATRRAGAARSSTSAYAVTPALREWYVEGDHGGAGVRRRGRGRPGLAAAARRRDDGSAAPGRARGRGARRRRRGPAPDVDRAAVRLAGAGPAVGRSCPPRSTTRSAGDDVRRALAALPAADAGDDDAAVRGGRRRGPRARPGTPPRSSAPARLADRLEAVTATHARHVVRTHARMDAVTQVPDAGQRAGPAVRTRQRRARRAREHAQADGQRAPAS